MTRSRFFAAFAFASCLLVTAVAWADSLVVVQVRNASQEPVDGRVTLQPVGEGEALTCTTESGSCRLDGVPGGRYTVRFQAPGQQPTSPRAVMIPPAGTVRLNVAAP